MITPSSYLLSWSSHQNLKEVDSQTVNVFGKSFQELSRRLENKSKMTNISYSFFSVAAATHFGGGASFIFKNDVASLYILFYSAIISVAFLYTPYLFSHRFGLNAEDFLEGGKLLENFLDTYKEFKSKPEDEKVTRLFSDFSIMGEASKWLLIAKNNRLIKKKDLDFFHCFGKFILMIETTNILLKKCKHSLFLKKWAKELKSPHTTLIWESIGVQGEKLKFYNSFQTRYSTLKMISLTEKVRLLFISALDQGLLQHII